MRSNNSIRKTAIASAVALALGDVCEIQPVLADSVTADFTGVFTLVNPNGGVVQNPDAPSGAPYYQNRTSISGTLSFDLADGTGSTTVAPFSFQGGGPAIATTVSFQDIGNGSGGEGNLLLGNMGFNWSGNNGIPVSIVWDASGFLAAGGDGYTTGETITGGATPATDSLTFSKYSYTLPIGPSPFATTTWNTLTVGGATCTLGCNPSGTLPLSADTIGGSPMPAGPFAGFNANFDLANVVITSFTDTTPPVVTISPETISSNVGDAFDPLNPPGVTITVDDAVDGPLDLAVDCVVDDGVDPNTAGNYTVTYDCSDSSGNSNSDDPPLPTLNVNVVTAGAPAITLLGNNPVIHEAATPYSDPGATCADSGGPIAEGPDFSLDTSALDVNVLSPPNQTVTWACTNTFGTTSVPRGVTVQDTTPPVITLTPDCGTGANAIVQVADGIDPTPAATAVDPNYNTDLTSDIVQTGDMVNPSPVFGSSLSETYVVIFQVSDAADPPNPATATCEIILGNPDPVATLLGNATVVLSSGSGYDDPGATCEGFDINNPDTALPLPDAVPDQSIDASTPDGTYTITYTCTDNQGDTGTTTRQVVVGASFSAADDSESNFTMINPTGDLVGGADDIFFSWNGSLYTTNDPANQAPNMSMGSALPQPFFGFPWSAHDIRAFGPGDYTFTTSRGGTLNLHVDPDQIGAHMLFDWSTNLNIDVVLAWDLNGVFVGSNGTADDLGAKGKSFALASIDADGDGLPGVPMADGPFKGFNANFNIKLTPLFALPDAMTSAAQGGNDPATVIVSTTDPVTVTATVNPDVNNVYTYQGPFTYDWSMSDAALLAVNTNGTSSSTFVFNPDSLPDGPVTATVMVTDMPTGLTTTVPLPLQVTTGNTTNPNVMDSDADGIPDDQDAIDNNADPGRQQGVFGDGNSFVLTSSAGKLVMGETASAVGVASAQYDTTVTGAEIGITDPDFTTSCIGECFSFKVTGLMPGSAVDVVLPLALEIPDDGVVRKLINGTWRDFVTTGGNSQGNAIMSAPGAQGDCSAPGPYTPGLTPGNFCLKLTIVDGGPNDADGHANGVVVDPVGIAGGGAAAGKAPGNTGSPDNGGCTLGNAPVSAGKRGDWWLLAGLLAWLGSRVHRRRTQ
jgi:hypothetical protein